MEAAKAKREAAVTKHVVASDETLSGIALSGIAKKYYDDAGKYMKIYEANKEVIGGDPGLIQPGMELVIPEL
jgi:nucleoid-associated protein YgaU